MPDTFVLDCSVAAKWIFPEPGRAAALGLFERFSSREVLLIAPDLLLAEFASLVAKRNRGKQISAAQAQEAWVLMNKCAPRLFDMRPRLFRALDLSLQYQLSLWDCVYLALALEHECPVLTADLRLFRAGQAGTLRFSWCNSPIDYLSCTIPKVPKRAPLCYVCRGVMKLCKGKGDHIQCSAISHLPRL